MKKYTAADIQILTPTPEMLAEWDAVDISREAFSRNLDTATRVARDFTREYVFNILPDTMRYVVRLGCSYDDNPLAPDERAFPEDYKEPDRQFDAQDDIVNLLWRDGAVPEWIDVQVIDADATHTYVELKCCGRFSANPRSMYHPQEGRAPVHVIGPWLPPPWGIDGDHRKFDLHWQLKK